MTTLRILLACTLLTVGVGLWSYTTPVAAAEAAPDSEPGDTGTTEDADSEATSGNPSTEVFIPTEEISEDFAVSFPVDI